MRTRIPKWVKKLPDGDVNKLTLLEIAKSKADLNGPFHLFFSINNVISKKDVDALTNRLQNDGWGVQSFDDIEDKSKFWIEGFKTKYLFSEQQLTSDEAYFRRLAKQYDATYDGWYVKL